MNRLIKNNAGIIKMNFKSLFLSKGFYASIALNLVVLIVSYFLRVVETANGLSGVCYTLMSTFYLGMLTKVVVLASALPVVTGFCTDWNTQYIRTVVGRAGIKRYLRHKVLFCIAGTFITTFISLWLFVLFLRTRMPMITTADVKENLMEAYPFGCVVEISPYLFILFKIICISIYCSFWSVAGLAISAYIPNRFVVLTVPFVLCYIFEIVYENTIADFSINIPNFLKFSLLGIAELGGPLFGNPVIDLLYIVLLFFGLSLLEGRVFINGAKRRINNEIV